MSLAIRFLIMILFVLIAPLIGGLIDGLDRKISARLQGRIGPPIHQPFIDFYKLIHKETTVINSTQTFYVALHLIFMVITGMIIFFGGDLLLMVFALTLSGVFLVIAAYDTNSPYSIVGANREITMMLADEPILLLVAVGFYMVTNSFNTRDILAFEGWPVAMLPGLFIAFVFILTIKFRKSPFDISTSHHAHQEVVKGITTEFSGRTLAMIELAHWYEIVFLLAVVFLFFGASSPLSIAVGVVVTVLAYLVEILIDNAFARVTWERALRDTWLIAGSLATLNLLIIGYFR